MVQDDRYDAYKREHAGGVHTPQADAWAGDPWTTPQASGLPANEERGWAWAAHWLPLLTHWFGPLVILLTLGRVSPRVRAEAAASFNWEVTVALLLALAVGLSVWGQPVAIGGFGLNGLGPALALAVIVMSFGLHIVAAVRVSRGGTFTYPFALPFAR